MWIWWWIELLCNVMQLAIVDISFRRHQIGLGWFHFLFGARWKSIKLRRLEHDHRMFCCHFNCELLAFISLTCDPHKTYILFILITGSMPHTVATCHLPKSTSSATDFHIFWAVILFCHKCAGETIYRSYVCSASIHLTSFCVNTMIITITYSTHLFGLYNMIFFYFSLKFGLQ